MRWCYLSVVLACAACGSSADDGVTSVGELGGDATGGTAVGHDSGVAGGAKGTGGASGGAASGTGGAKSTGGATGSGGAKSGTGGSADGGGVPIVDAAPPVVHPCSSLPSGTQWEKITPPGDIGDSQDVVLHPTESGTVYVGMHKGGNGSHYPTDGLYKSTDCGATWLPRVSVGENGDAFGQGSLWSFAIDPVEPDVMFAITGYGAGGIWKTTTGGVDWKNSISSDLTQYVPYNFFQSLSMEPTNRQHLVVTAHSDCTGPYAPGCLAESTDSGATWRLIMVPWGWAEGAGVYALGPKMIAVSIPFTGVELTTDGGATWNRVTDRGGGNDKLYRSPDGTYFMPALNGVYRTSDLLTWSLIPDSGGRTVSLVGSEANMYTSDQWARSYHTASVADPTKWTSFTIAGMPANDGQGAPFMAYDRGHHILYSSNFAGGFWRIVTP
jgi:hypothetical protein